jgi:hypothetical protein
VIAVVETERLALVPLPRDVIERRLADDGELRVWVGAVEGRVRFPASWPGEAAMRDLQPGAAVDASVRWYVAVDYASASAIGMLRATPGGPEPTVVIVPEARGNGYCTESTSALSTHLSAPVALARRVTGGTGTTVRRLR